MEKKKILVVDDEESFCRIVKLNLEETGEYEVRTESEGAKAINTARAFRPDVILLDIVMPDTSGDDIACQIKLDQGLKNIPIVFLTALVSKAEVNAKGSIIGNQVFLAKPVNTEKLVTCIEKCLKK